MGPTGRPPATVPEDARERILEPRPRLTAGQIVAPLQLQG
jgi:hypothetical protein